MVQGDKVACVNWDGSEPLKAITWDLKTKLHRQVDLDLVLRSVQNNPDDWNEQTSDPELTYFLLDYETIEVIQCPQTLSAVSFTESGIAIHCGVEFHCSTAICKVSRVDLSTNCKVAEYSIWADDLKIQIESRPSSMPDVRQTTMPQLCQHIDDSTSCTYLKLGSQDCYIHLVANGTRSVYDFARVSCGAALSTSTYCAMEAGPEKTEIYFTSWDHLGDMTNRVSEITDGRSGVELKTRSGSYHFLGNGRFLVVWQGTRLHIYCFDRSYKLANEDPMFKNENEKRLEMRRRERTGSIDPNSP